MVLRVPHARENMGVVGFDLHASAAAKSLLPPPQFAV